MVRTLLSLLVLIGAMMYGVSNTLKMAEPRNFVFSPEKLQALSQTCVQTYGNDTRAMVTSIVDQLRQDPSVSSYISQDEEWIFNNAGGAMGAMYLIHASKPTFTQLQARLRYFC